MKKFNREYLILLGIVAVYLAFTAYHLRSLPGEWYGDISIENKEVRAILQGGWPWRFDASAGPAYHYVVAGFAAVLGPTYGTYKLASLVTGLVVVLLTYVYGREIAGRRVGLLAAAVTAVSFWLIVFARLGSSPQILSPVLALGTVIFAARFERTQHWLNLAISMVFAGFGLFTYPSTFVLPLIVLALIGWKLVISRPRLRWAGALALAVALMIPFSLWFVTLAKADSDFGPGGYVGSKITARGTTPEGTLLAFSKNMLKAVSMFQFVGDASFRTNAAGKPMLDPISGVLMALGLVWLFLDPRLRPRWAYVIVPLLLLLAPSADPGLPAAEIPSASRALGAAPFAFFLAGLGLDAAWEKLSAFLRDHRGAKTRLPAISIAILFLSIAILNVSKYFGPYAWGLPEHNQPWGWQIAQYLDTLPQDVTVKLAACCWGERGQPEPMGIYYVLQHPQGREWIISEKYVKGCQDVPPGEPTVIIFPPDSDSPLANQIRRCFPNTVGQMHHDGLGKPNFYTLYVK